MSNGQGLTYWLCADEMMLHEVLQALLQGKEPNVPQKSLAELNVNRERLEQGRRALTKECLRKIQKNYAKSVCGNILTFSWRCLPPSRRIQQ